MTVYGGEKNQWGTISKGFFVNCTRCGWHSEVSVYPAKDADGNLTVRFKCNKCGNEHEE